MRLSAHNLNNLRVVGVMWCLGKQLGPIARTLIKFDVILISVVTLVGVGRLREFSSAVLYDVIW